MTLSPRHISTLVELVDVELRVLDAYRHHDSGAKRIPLLESCKQQLLHLGATERAYRKKSFPEISARKSRPPQAAETPDHAPESPFPAVETPIPRREG